MKQTSFLDVVLLINGIEISGFDEGDDVIQLARRGDSASDIVGADGEMTVSTHADLSGLVTFRLMQQSDSSLFLSGLVTVQESGLFVPISVQFKDTLGTALGSGTSGYIPKPADITRGKSPNSEEWMIVVERLNLIH